jgi:AraC family transcriptional regulator
VIAAGLRRSVAGWALEIEEAVLGVLSELGREIPARRGRRPAWLARSVERLREPDAPSISALADEAGVHPVYFTRAFRAAVCAAPSEVARRARLERASAALLASGSPLTAVACDAGFADHSHFCRQFRREFGVTPSRYRALFV